MVDALTSGGPAEARALLVLDALPGVGPAAVGRLVAAFGSGLAALSAPAPAFRALAGRPALEARGDPARHGVAERALERAEALGIAVVTWADAAYPARLGHLADPPPVLFLRGREALLRRPGVAVVGARRATARGREVARRLGGALGAAGVTVVSGLALGVDGAAHAGALAADGPTVAVLGSGPDRAYPRSHAALFRSVVHRGLVVSEFPPGTPALRHHFPRRNRVLAGLAHTVVVVEAGVRSGALITVDHALDLGLDVYAVPGPIDRRTTLGSNALLRDGARPLVSIEEFVGAVAPRGTSAGDESGGGARPPPDARSLDQPSDDGGAAAAVLRSLGDGPRDVDAVSRATGLAPARALAVLTRLELQGRARRIPGQRFRRAG